MRSRTMQSAEFKAKCLKLMDEVNEQHLQIIITKHGHPVAKLVPLEAQPQPEFFGCLQQTIQIKHDITATLEENWEADE